MEKPRGLQRLVIINYLFAKFTQTNHAQTRYVLLLGEIAILRNMRLKFNFLYFKNVEHAHAREIQKCEF